LRRADREKKGMGRGKATKARGSNPSVPVFDERWELLVILDEECRMNSIGTPPRSSFKLPNQGAISCST